MDNEKIYHVFWDSWMLWALAWLCWFVAGMKIITVLLTLITGPPEWNRIDYLLEAGLWVYIGALHMTLADYRKEPNEELD